MERTLENKLLQSDERQDLKGRIWIESKKLWTVAGPSILTRISSFGILVVTQAFMGHIGETELSSYALVLTLITRFANGIMLGKSCALETLCGQAFGAKQYHMMGIYLQRSWIILTIAAIIILPLYIWTAQILRLLGEGDELSEMAGQIALWFIPIVFYFMFSATLQFYLQAQLKNSIIAWLSSASFMIHVALSWIFVIKLGSSYWCWLAKHRGIGCYYVIGVRLGILLGYVAHLQIQGIWIGMICGIAAQTLVLVFMTGKTVRDLQVEKVTARLEGWFVPDESKDVDDVTSIA